MSAIQNSFPKILACLAGMTLASAAFGQAPRNSLDVAVSTGASEFKDSKTGQVWTPETVGRDGRPLTQPDDKAFNPQAQNVPLQVVEQRVRGAQNQIVGNCECIVDRDTGAASRKLNLDFIG